MTHILDHTPLTNSMRQRLDHIQTNYPQHYDNYINLLDDYNYTMNYDYDNTDLIDQLDQQLSDLDQQLV